MIDLDYEIFTISKKRYTLKAYSENYLGNIDISFDDYNEYQAITKGVSLKLISIHELDGNTLTLENANQLEDILNMHA